MIKTEWNFIESNTLDFIGANKLGAKDFAEIIYCKYSLDKHKNWSQRKDSWLTQEPTVRTDNAGLETNPYYSEARLLIPLLAGFLLARIFDKLLRNLIK